MLDGDVDVGQHLGRVADGSDELVGHSLGLQVEHAQPRTVGAHDHREAHEQARERVALTQVPAPDARVLADEHELAHALLGKRTDLARDLGERARGVAAADVGDGAEGAEAVAAVGDLDVGARPLDGAQRLRKRARARALGGGHNRLVAKDFVHDAHDAVLGVGAHEGRDLGELVGELVAVARGHATAHNDGQAAHALLGSLGKLERALDALGGGAGKEGAGVDDDGVGLVDLGGLGVAGAQ